MQKQSMNGGAVAKLDTGGRGDSLRRLALPLGLLLLQ
jgi:hypothetical protein